VERTNQSSVLFLVTSVPRGRRDVALHHEREQRDRTEKEQVSMSHARLRYHPKDPSRGLITANETDPAEKWRLVRLHRDCHGAPVY
jgi:hypothetical protein